MANSKLLKDAIADAKAVRETAIANAKIALEEAFTPRLQSILSQKLQQEMEEEDEDEEDVNEEYGAEDAPTGTSSSIGKGSNGTESGTNGKQPSGDATQSHTDLDPETGKISDKVGTEDDNVTVVTEDEQQDDDNDGVIDDPTGAIYNEDEDFDAESQFGGEDEEEEDEDELDLESIIRELEAEMGDDEEDEYMDEEEDEDEDDSESGEEVFVGADEEGDSEFDTEVSDEEGADFGGEEEDDIDLDEILREMGYGDDEEELEESEDGDEDDSEAYAEKEAELEEALKVIRSLKGTINEVHLLNAKLLYSNKLFRNYELTNEQKMKVVETLDRTANVREVKLVFATLAESLKYGNTTQKKRVKKITESFASDVVKSTAPSKNIISESNDFATRFKQLANIGQKK